jgi:hypothetical protein
MQRKGKHEAISRCKCIQSLSPKGRLCSFVLCPQTLLPLTHREQESQRAARLRDNKRRNRQRQKDYTSSLEAKLRDLQSQGVQATQEVQLSARKVVADNARLKALLRHVGVADHVIETWTPPTYGEGSGNGNGNSADQPSEKPSACAGKCMDTSNEKVSNNLPKVVIKFLGLT